MDPLALSAEALREPWRLWTCHLAHFGWEHALANFIALAVPALLVPRRERGRLLLVLLVAAPLLSLLLLPGLGQGQYRGASGLACVAWAWVGLRLLSAKDSTAVGLLMLGALLFKLVVESPSSNSLLLHPVGWQALPAAHLWGTFLGMACALPTGFRTRHARCPPPGRLHESVPLLPSALLLWYRVRPDLSPAAGGARPPRSSGECVRRLGGPSALGR
jgi:membrane associated rhomboid family serine protease